MEVGALGSEESDGGQDLSPRQVDALQALFRRLGKGKGKGGKPDVIAGPPNGGGGKGKGEGGKGFQGECWRCHE
eukprot:14934085-Alexandrium_andersonii.AAC.1